MDHWLVKSEPIKYSWEKFEKDGNAVWDGVRNYAARNNLRAMKKGDLVFFYHSNEGMEIVGIAKVAKEHYPDPTTDDPAWLVVNLKPFKKLKKAVPLSLIKTDKKLQDIALVRIPRLSVMPLKKVEFDHILALSEKK
jgi:predicted RNA-binding protein with PUA-like domain